MFLFRSVRSVPLYERGQGCVIYPLRRSRPFYKKHNQFQRKTKTKHQQNAQTHPRPLSKRGASQRNAKQIFSFRPLGSPLRKGPGVCNLPAPSITFPSTKHTIFFSRKLIKIIRTHKHTPDSSLRGELFIVTLKKKKII